MASLTEVQRLIGLSLNKLQMGRTGRGGLSLHKNLLVATVLNKARDVYMQETMYMNYRLMACGQFGQEEQEDMEDEDTPDTEDYEEDSESDVEEETGDSSLVSPKEYVGGVLASPTVLPMPADLTATTSSTIPLVTKPSSIPLSVTQTPPSTNANSDEGFIDESDCDCDARNYRADQGETRVPFQYCFNCAPFHPSNGRGPTLVGPQPLGSTSPSPPLAGGTHQETGDKIIYDMDSKSTASQPSTLLKPGGQGKRKRQISSVETEDAVASILPKRRRKSGEAKSPPGLDDSGFQEEEEEEEKTFHPAFRGQIGTGPNGTMEVDQITSLVSIFSFGQHVLPGTTEGSPVPGGGGTGVPGGSITGVEKTESSSKDDGDDSDSDSDTSSDSGHSSDDPESDKTRATEEGGGGGSCASQAAAASELQSGDLEPAGPAAVAAAV